MNWQPALNRELYDTEAERQLKAEILRSIPVFKASTHPKEWRKETARLQREALKHIYLHGYSKETINKHPKVVWGETLRPDKTYVIRKLRYEVYPDFWIPGLLYEPARITGRVPVILNPNGHHIGGKSCDYKQIRCVNLARRGMIALNMEFIGMGELEGNGHLALAHLAMTGLAGPGIMYLSLSKGLDILLAHKHADRRRVAVTGLSGGGWQTIVIAALDRRVTLAAPAAGYTATSARVNIKPDIGDLEQAPADMTTVLDYQHMTAMLAPRPALLILNERDDCCFATARSKPVIFDAIRPVYEALNAGNKFEYHSNKDPGTHNYGADNRNSLYRFLNRHFKLDTPGTDIHQPHDLLPASKLTVGLPASQQTIQTIARTRAYEICASRRPLRKADHTRLRARITDLIRLESYRTTSQEVCRTGDQHLHLLQVGRWTVPVTAATPDTAVATELLIADDGRPYWGGGQALDGTRHVFAADIFDTGENKCNWQLKMLFECAGRRLLGVQVGQILACARWAARETGMRRIHLTASGDVMSTVALIAAALRPAQFLTVSVTACHASLKYLFDVPVAYEHAQSLLCPGLLEACDIPQLMDLLDNVTYLQPGSYIPPN